MIKLKKEKIPLDVAGHINFFLFKGTIYGKYCHISIQMNDVQKLVPKMYICVSLMERLSTFKCGEIWVGHFRIGKIFQ